MYSDLSSDCQPRPVENARAGKPSRPLSDDELHGTSPITYTVDGKPYAWVPAVGATVR